MDSVVDRWEEMSFKEEILPKIKGNFVDFNKRRVMEYSSYNMTKQSDQREIVLVGPCNPCFAIGIEHREGMFVCHLVTEECIEMQPGEVISQMIETLSSKVDLSDVTSFFIFTRPYWDQDRDDLYDCQCQCAEELKTQLARLFSESVGRQYLISKDQYNPYIAVVWNGSEFSLAVPADLSFVILSLKAGDGVSFAFLDEDYGKEKSRYDQRAARANYFKAAQVFKERFEARIPAKIRPVDENAMNWFYNHMLSYLQSCFIETGQVAELGSCLWGDEIYETEIKAKFDAFTNSETFLTDSLSIFLKYIFPKYYQCALFAEYNERVRPLLSQSDEE
jgi:hypothetical protein